MMSGGGGGGPVVTPLAGGLGPVVTPLAGGLTALLGFGGGSFMMGSTIVCAEYCPGKMFVSFVLINAKINYPRKKYLASYIELHSIQHVKNTVFWW